jgi:hypothetical protein
MLSSDEILAEIKKLSLADMTYIQSSLSETIRSAAVAELALKEAELSNLRELAGVKFKRSAARDSSGQRLKKDGTPWGIPGPRPKTAPVADAPSVTGDSAAVIKEAASRKKAAAAVKGKGEETST